MSKLVGLIADLLRNLFPKWFGSVKEEVSAELSEELHFLRERKELSASRLWLLDILEKNENTRFSTNDLYTLWMPLVVGRTDAEESHVSKDSVFIRLQQLVALRFISLDSARKGKVWYISEDYRPYLINRDPDATIMTVKDEEDLIK